MNKVARGEQFGWLLCLFASAFGLMSPAQAAGATRTWNNTGTNFNAAASWTNSYGPPVAADAAQFSGAEVTQPTLTAIASVNTLNFPTASSAGYDLTAGPGASVTLNAGSPLTGSSGASIYGLNTSGTNTVDAPVVLNAANKTNQFNQSAGGTLIVNGAISEGHPGTALSLNTGPIRLYGNNTYTGDTYVNGSGSTLTITNFNSLGLGSRLGIYGTFYYQGAGESTGRIIDMNAAAHGATIDTTGAGGPLVLTADMQASSTGARTLVIQGDNAATNEVQGKIVDGSGTTTLWKYGLGTWKLSGASTFSGGSLLRYGAVILGNKSALGSGMVEIRGVSISASTDLSGPNAVANNVSLDTDTPTFTGTNSIEFSGVVTNALSVQVITDNLSAGNLVFSGNLYLSDVNTGFRAVTITGPGAAIVSGNIANNSGGNTNPCTLTYSGSGRLTLSGSNTYCGVTTVSSGILLLNSPNALPGGSGSTGGSAWLKISGGVVGLGNGDFLRALGSATNQAQFYSPGGGFAAYGADRAVNLGGVSAGVTWNTGGFVSTSNALVLGAASADHTVDFQNPIALATAVRTVQVDDGSAAVDARLSGALTGTGISGLTKTGLGTLELTATNNYAGATTVAAGRLLVDGVTSGQSNYVVNAGGTLGGTGTVGLASGRTVTVGAGGTLAPGVNGVGTLNLNGGLVFGENACYAWEYKDGSGDRVSVSGALQLPSVATVTVTQISGALPTPAVLFSAGSLTGASDLSGWVITGSYTAKIGSTNVILIAHHPGTVIGVR